VTLEPQMPNLRDMALEHFNEPMLSFGKLVRCIGYGETAVDCYIIVKDSSGKETWNTCVGGYTFLHGLRGQNHVKAHNGEDWDDLTRLEGELPPKEAEFKLVLNFDDWEGFPPRSLVNAEDQGEAR
jgi:hypothetical protein